MTWPNAIFFTWFVLYFAAMVLSWWMERGRGGRYARYEWMVRAFMAIVTVPLLLSSHNALGYIVSGLIIALCTASAVLGYIIQRRDRELDTLRKSMVD